MKEEINFKIRVMCMTYNQAQYIQQTLDGFCEQKTSFPFVCVVMDDASNDGEINILKDYLNNNFEHEGEHVEISEETEDYVLFFTQHRKNRNCYFAVYLLKYNHYKNKKSRQSYFKRWNSVKYEAICEGDDYWIDSLKLQKQVSFLDANPEYGLIYTNHYNRIGEKIVNFQEKGYTEFEDIVIYGGVGTLTSCVRFDLLQRYFEEIKPEEKGWKMGDAPRWKFFACHSKVKFLPDYTAVYRILPNSASHFKDIEKEIAFIESGYDIQCFFIDKYVDNKTKHDSLKTIVNRNRIDAIYGVLYTNRKKDRLKEFMKDKWSVLDIKTRVLYYLQYILLLLKGAKE